MLKGSPWKGLFRFGKKGKLNPRFIGPFEITQRFGEVAYHLNMPSEFEGIHNVFQVSCLRKTLFDMSQEVSLNKEETDKNLRYQEQPEEILEKKYTKIQNKNIGLVKLKWRHHRGAYVK